MMGDKEKRRFRAACKRVSDSVGTPAFEGAMLQFYVALGCLKKKEAARAN